MNFCKTTISTVALVCLLFLTQCSDDPANQAASAEVVEDAEAETAALELANSLDFGGAEESVEEVAAPADEGESRVFVFEENSKIGFIGSKLTAIHEGSFQNFSGHFTVAGDGIDRDGTHRISIDMSSVTTDDPKLTEHLKSEDFFHVSEYPVAIFSLLQMTLTDEAESGYQVAGVLDLHGVKKKITFPATIAIGEKKESVSMQAKFSIDRKVFGIEYPGLPDDLIRDRVVIDLDLQAIPGDPKPLQLPEPVSGNSGGPMILSAPTAEGAGRGFGGGPPQGGRGGRGGRGGGTPAEIIARMDGNGDGFIGKDEAPEFLWERISAADTDGDGLISEAEYTVHRAQQEAEGGGPGGAGGPAGGGFGGGRGGGEKEK